MADAPNQPPEQVRAAAAVVQKWLDEQPKPGASLPVPESAAERFDRFRMRQHELSRTQELNLRKARS